MFILTYIEYISYHGILINWEMRYNTAFFELVKKIVIQADMEKNLSAD